MDHHQSIAATCEQTVAALSTVLSAHGYWLERSFDLRSTRHAAPTDRDQYLVLLAYEQATPAPPAVITLHEYEGITQLSVAGSLLAAQLVTVLNEIGPGVFDAMCLGADEGGLDSSS